MSKFRFAALSLVLAAGPAAHAAGPAGYPARPVTLVVPIAHIADSPTVLVVTSASPFRTVTDFVAYAHAHPGTLNFASGGKGTSVHLAGELFRTLTGAQMVHVPYRGSALAMTDLIGGQVQSMDRTEDMT